MTFWSSKAYEVTVYESISRVGGPSNEGLFHSTCDEIMKRVLDSKAVL